MKRLLHLFFLFAITFVSAKDPAVYMEGRLPSHNGRYKTFHEVLTMLNARDIKVIVETGTERWQEPQYCFDGDGGATIIFGHWAHENGAKMYSVDIDPTHVRFAKANTESYRDCLSIILSDSVAYLKEFDQPIDFLYLDSYDYNENNPGPPQQHCLNEVLAAEDKLTENAIVMIDDCNIPGGGKGKRAIEYLLSRGWSLHRNFHHVILVRK